MRRPICYLCFLEQRKPLGRRTPPGARVHPYHPLGAPPLSVRQMRETSF